MVKSFFSMMPKKTITSKFKYHPICNIFMDKETKNFVLENWAIDDKLRCIGFGPFIHISNEKMKENGLSIIRQNLDSFFYRKVTEKSEYGKMTNTEEQRFLKNHKNVGIHLENKECLTLLPMPREGGGYIGKPEDRINVNLPCTNEEFYQKLMEAFDKC